MPHLQTKLQMREKSTGAGKGERSGLEGDNEEGELKIAEGELSAHSKALQDEIQTMKVGERDISDREKIKERENMRRGRRERERERDNTKVAIHFVIA